MFAEERQAEIVRMIQSGTPARVDVLSKKFGVSGSTIRRDLQELENSGLIQRTHGGAIPVQSGFELSFKEKEIYFLEEKQQIAAAACSMVKDGDSVFLDTGTTNLELAYLLRKKRITLATNSMDIADIFSNDDQVDLLLLGGLLRRNTRSLVGYLTNETLQRLHFDKVFLAANAVDLTLGITTPNLQEAETKRRMANSGQEKILLADHSKIGQKCLYQAYPLDSVDLLITDSGIDMSLLSELNNSVQVVLAPEINHPCDQQELLKTR